MSKVKKMADGGIAGLGSLMSSPGGSTPQTLGSAGINGVPGTSMTGPQFGRGGGGGGSASDGLGQINQGASTVSGAIARASGELGSGGGSVRAEPQGLRLKKGGSIKKYSEGGKLNLADCKVSTAKTKPRGNY
jgi:hypothetical protein